MKPPNYVMYDKSSDYNQDKIIVKMEIHLFKGYHSGSWAALLILTTFCPF